ncbi:hypothetical protein RJ640_014969 [Escallonia rubra]|uniref:Mediator complex subunit 15 n=1 Tax=Escallonia rubra TaxID=112253 RepID=A0AA88R1C3_9ASTE|nr:hypothetical protein RJ640_014969 [Escallonia rubra]
MSQVNNQGQRLPISVPANQQLLSQNLHNNIAQTGVPGSSGLTSSLPPVSSLSQTTMQNVVGSNSNLQNTQNISGVAHNSVENTMGPGVPANMFANSQTWQQQPQGQNQQHYLYQQPLQQQLMKPKFPQGNIPHSLLQSQMQQQQQQQQQQQNLLQQSQLQSSQQPVMQSSQLSNVQQNQQNPVEQSSQPVLQQHPQSVLRQQRQQQQSPIIHQQQQQPILPTQQHQQHLMGQLPNATNMQQNQLMGQPNSIPDIQQQQQRLLSQQNKLSNLQQQQLMAQQNNNLPNMHQQQLGPQNDVNGLQEQQQQLLGTQSTNSSMLTNQHTVHMVQSQPKVPVQQQTQQSTATMMPIQGQQSQPLSQQQMMSHVQSQPGQVGLQQQPNPLQRDMQQRIQASGTLLPQQNVIDQQKQLFQPQRAIPEASSASLDSTAQTGNASGGDLQEEIYQKIKAMKDMYLADLSEMYQKIAGKLQQHDSLPQQPKNEQLEKLKIFKTMLERLITFLQVPKSSVIPGFKDKLGAYEKQITNFLHSNRPRKPVSSMQQGQALSMHSMQQPQPQMTQMQNHDSQMNPQMQSMNLQGSVATMQQNTMNSLQHNSLSPLLGVSNAQQSMMNSLLPSSTLDPGQNNALNTLQQVAVGSLQQDPVSGPQQVNLNPLSSQGGMNRLQPTLNPLQSNSNMAQHQHLKQQE